MVKCLNMCVCVIVQLCLSLIHRAFILFLCFLLAPCLSSLSLCVLVGVALNSNPVANQPAFLQPIQS